MKMIALDTPWTKLLGNSAIDPKDALRDYGAPRVVKGKVISGHGGGKGRPWVLSADDAETGNLVCGSNRAG